MTRKRQQATVTMLDYEGSPVKAAPPTAGSSKGRVGGKMHLEDVSLGVKASPKILNEDSQRGSS